MGWFYEVDISNEELHDDDKLWVPEIGVIVQGKNSSRDYQDYYMLHGKPYRYRSLDELMPETEGSSDDIRLLASYKDGNNTWHYIDFKPVFFNGRWFAEKVEE